jgi:hypothetical protein
MVAPEPGGDERRVARGSAMTAEFPPPDGRLAGKVKVLPLSASRVRSPTGQVMTHGSFRHSYFRVKKMD